MITNEKFIKFIKKFLGWILLSVIIICVISYWKASEYLDNKLTITHIAVNIFKDISANTIPSAIVAVISIYFFKTLEDFLHEGQNDVFSQNIADKVSDQLAPHLKNNCEIKNKFNDVDWAYYFSNSKKITISTHYLDSWISTNQASIETFFKAGGELEVILPKNNVNKSYITLIKSRFPNRDKNISISIQSCKDKFNSIKKQIINGKLIITESKKFPWCFYMLCDDKSLIISPYEGIVNEISVRAPTICIDIKSNKDLYDWITKELDHLKSS